MSDAISGSTIPLNLSILYDFPFSLLQESIRYFSGDQDLLLADGENPGAHLGIREGFQFTDSVEEAQHIRVLLTYQHEQFHLRHLTASPIGLLLYMVEARQYAYIYSFLQRWGARIGLNPEAPIRLPLTTEHGEDPEIRDLQAVREVYAVYQALFMESLGDLGEMPLLKAASGIFSPLADELAKLGAGILGSSDAYPLIDVGENYNESVNPAGLTGRAVLEGLARVNELMTLASLGVPMDTINEVIVEKQHGIYGKTIGIAGTLLNVRSVDAWMLTARLSDWAMQAPVLPFLLRERESVSILELLPAWRYFLLVSRFGQAGFKVKDLLEREREVAAHLFGGLGWEDPWQVANRILEANLPSPKSALTRHYFGNLRLGAELRLNNPAIMSFPTLGDQGHRLQAVFNIFPDGIQGGSTGKLAEDKDSWSLIASLVSDATADALMVDKDLTRSLQYARMASAFFGGKPTAGELLSQALVQCLGQAGAQRVLDATGFLQTAI